MSRQRLLVSHALQKPHMLGAKQPHTTTDKKNRNAEWRPNPDRRQPPGGKDVQGPAFQAIYISSTTDKSSYLFKSSRLSLLRALFLVCLSRLGKQLLPYFVLAFSYWLTYPWCMRMAGHSSWNMKYGYAKISDMKICDWLRNYKLITYLRKTEVQKALLPVFSARKESLWSKFSLLNQLIL